jgi:hypothetical protein
MYKYLLWKFDSRYVQFSYHIRIIHSMFPNIYGDDDDDDDDDDYNDDNYDDDD